jgi:hypothetical protein
MAWKAFVGRASMDGAEIVIDITFRDQIGGGEYTKGYRWSATDNITKAIVKAAVLPDLNSLNASDVKVQNINTNFSGADVETF